MVSREAETLNIRYLRTEFGATYVHGQVSQVATPQFDPARPPSANIACDSVEVYQYNTNDL